jgi:HEAT repeat protein
MKKGEVTLKPLVKVGTIIKKHQILASVMHISDTIPCDNVLSEDHYLKLVKSTSLSDRYEAAKALSYFKSAKTMTILKEKLNDEKEHIYIRLESAASLLKMGSKESVPFFEEILNDAYLENRLDCVIVLGEIEQSE